MFKSKILDELGQKYQTDKCSTLAGSHDYLRKYEFFFRPFKDEEFTFLELGIFKGASLKIWADYFNKAQIVGVDCEEETQKHAGGRVKVILGDLSQTDFLKTLPSLNPKIILDDASHWWPDQLRALFVLYPTLMSGGLYIIEDIHTSFEPLAPMFAAGLDHCPFKVMAKVAEYMTGNDRPAPVVKDQILKPLESDPFFHDEIRFIADHTDAITFIERACILVKK